MDYLGVILEKGVTRMDPAKIAGVDMWPVPKNATEVRKVLGFFNFYRPFIEGFVFIAKPLHNISKTWDTLQVLWTTTDHYRPLWTTILSMEWPRVC